MAKIVYVANDVAPSEAFRRLNEVLPATTFLNRGQKDPLDQNAAIEAVKGADFVLLGMSNPATNAAVEIAVAEAARSAGIPFGFYSDIFGAFNRKWFEHLRLDADLVFVIAPGRDVERAQKVFPNAKVVCSYNPLWEDYFVPADPAEARALIAATDEEFIILTPGEKHAVNNIMLWGATIEAAAEVASSSTPVRVIVGPHPGDTKTPPEIYAPLVELGNELGFKVMMTPQGVKNDQIVPGLTNRGAIVQRGNSSLGIHGICRRVPVIDYYGPLSQRLHSRGSGDAHGYFYKTGAVIDLYSSEDALNEETLGGELYHIKELGGTSDEMHKAQEAAIPELKPGAAVANMKQAIEEIVGK